jgi:eukaryotic-like serine/threonine-protein kinase
MAFESVGCAIFPPTRHTATVEVRQTLGGRYKLLTELGTGGMAVVWRGRDEVLGRPVAVKVLAGRFVDDPQSRARIRDEARSAATLSHPNIAQVYDYGECTTTGSPLPYVVMELINGPTLQQRVSAGPLPPRTVFRICGEVAAALAAAHQDGLVHRDIKMANIMVTAAGAKVVDFGIAAAVGPAAPEEMLVGTPAYLAPERLTGADVEPASDVYALGVLLYRLLAHKAPWSAESTTQMLRAHVYLEPAPLPQLPGVPAAVGELVARCLRKDPAARPPAAEVSALLADAVEAGAAPDLPAPVPAETDHPVRAETDHPVRAETSHAVRAETGHAVRGESSHAVRGESSHAVRGETGHAGAASRGDDGVGMAVVRPRSGVDKPIAGPPSPAGSGRPAAPQGGQQSCSPDALLATVPSEPDVDGGGAPGVRRKWVLMVVAAVIAAVVVSVGVWVSASGRDSGGPGVVAAPTVMTTAPMDRVGTKPDSATTTGSTTAAATTAAAVVEPGRASASGVPPLASAASVTSASVAPSVPEVTPEPSGSVSSAPPAGSKLTSPGGVVYAQCANGKATLTGWEPAPDYAVQTVERGPGLTTMIVFKSPKARYRTTVTCVADLPAPVVLPL